MFLSKKIIKNKNAIFAKPSLILQAMLTQISIHNYILIQQQQLHFKKGFTVLTGETGAGKSIVMGALQLILGNRADTQVLLNKEKKCIVEGSFSINNNQWAKHFIINNDFVGDEENDVIIRREITPNGKSRAFINDTPATLQQLKELASTLVDLHQQFDTLALSESSFQREVVDALAGNQLFISQLQQVFQQYNKAQKQVEALAQQQLAFKKEQDYNLFLANELEVLHLQPNCIENWEQELDVLTNTETIKQTLQQAYAVLQEGENPLVNQLKQLQQQLQSVSKHSTLIADLQKRIQAAQIELADVADELETTNSSIEYNEEKIVELTDKLNAANKLLKKHQAKTTDELLKILEELQEKLKQGLELDVAIAEQQKLVNELQQQALNISKTISKNRHKISQKFESEVNELLTKVGMPNASIKLQLTPINLYAFGIDAVEILFNANKTNNYQSLSKCASGGELSRLMLCIKSLVAQHIQLPTLIFDEIDTGISGEAAKQVGIIMQQLSNELQIICITHQPQIAAKANEHLFVYKHIVNDTVQTEIKQLNSDEKIIELAKMLSGNNPSQAAILSVKEMMN